MQFLFGTAFKKFIKIYLNIICNACGSLLMCDKPEGTEINGVYCWDVCPFSATTVSNLLSFLHSPPPQIESH